MSVTRFTADFFCLSPQWGRYVDRGRVASEPIKEIRESRGMTCKILAGRIGARTENIRSWENGGTPKDPSFIDEMARALDVSTAYLFGECDDPGSYECLKELFELIKGGVR